MLDVRDLRLAFGGVRAVDGLTFAVHAGEIVSIIGPNGAGKTSAFNCVTGFYKPTGGRVVLDGTDITGRRPSAIAARGLSRTFQNLRVFGDLSVLDNVRAGTHLWLRQRLADVLLHTPRYRRSEQAATDEAHRWLDFTGLRGDRTGLVRHLPTASSGGSRSRGRWPVAVPAAARRARRRAQPRGEDRAARPDPADPGAGHRHRRHRARHGPGHGGLRPDRRTRPRQGDRRRHARPSPGRPRGDRGVSRPRRGGRAERAGAERVGAERGGARCSN